MCLICTVEMTQGYGNERLFSVITFVDVDISRSIALAAASGLIKILHSYRRHTGSMGSAHANVQLPTDRSLSTSANGLCYMY